jgi:hypothetical protein
VKWWLAIALAACGTARERSAEPWEPSKCDDIPPAIDAQLSQLDAPVRDHCERHGGRLYVRTMNTVAHDDNGSALPACRWEAFDLGSSKHLATFDTCELVFEGRCVASGSARQCF